jgi:hypothetical protein
MDPSELPGRNSAPMPPRARLGRRRLLRGMLLWGMGGSHRAGLLLPAQAAWLLPRPALAHHGFVGKYDFSRPSYLAGRIVQTYVGLPHARLTLDVPDDLYLPRDREWMRALEDAEARPTTTLLRTSERRGRLDVSLDRRLTRRLMDEPGLLDVDDPVEAVVYRRTTRDEYRNELHAVLLVLPDGRLLVSSSAAVISR